MNSLKRKIPDNRVLKWREEFLNNLIGITPIQSINLFGLEKGNTKLGYKGKYYNSMFVWNMPPIVTCPGASPWCKKSCYNADDRKDKFPIEKWQINWWHTLNNKNKLKKKINEQLSKAIKPCAVRLHSSGDFYSIEYIEFWQEIIKENRDISFWAYTRSWIVAELFPSLLKLKSLENIQLFASWDITMEMKPPKDWRLSIVIDNLKELENINTRKNYVCPEQLNKVDNCASCMFCTSNSTKNIVFTLH